MSQQHSITVMRDAEPLTLTLYDFQFLTGDWEGPHGGAAWNVVYTYCYNLGLGGYNDPTVRGREEIRRYKERHQRC